MSHADLKTGYLDVLALGNRLRVSVRGHGQPVLLINGLGAGIPLWRALQEDLDGLQVISFDAPGTGESSTPMLPYTIGALADAVVDLLDQLDLGEVDVVGYSFGGTVAQQLARDHPRRVRRLVLGATMCGWGAFPGELLSLLSVVTPVRYYSRRAYAFTAPLLAGGTAEAEPAFIERTATARVEAPPSAYGYWLQLLASWNWTSLPWLHEINHPTLVVTGAQDRLIPAINSELLTWRLQRARLLRIDGWGHYVLLDRQSGAGAAIADFLQAPQPERSRSWSAADDVSDREMAASARQHRNVLTTISWPHGLLRSSLTRRPSDERGPGATAPPGRASSG